MNGKLMKKNESYRKAYKYPTIKFNNQQFKNGVWHYFFS